LKNMKKLKKKTEYANVETLSITQKETIENYKSLPNIET